MSKKLSTHKARQAWATEIESMATAYGDPTDGMHEIKQDVLRKVAQHLRAIPEDQTGKPTALINYILQLYTYQWKWKQATAGGQSKVWNVLYEIRDHYHVDLKPLRKIAAEINLMTSGDADANHRVLVKLAKESPDLLEIVLLNPKRKKCFMSLLLANHGDIPAVLTAIQGMRLSVQLQVLFPVDSHANPLRVVAQHAPTHVMAMIKMMEPLLGVKRVPPIAYTNREKLYAVVLRPENTIADLELLQYYMLNTHFGEMAGGKSPEIPAVTEGLAKDFDLMMQVATDYRLLGDFIGTQMADAKDEVHALESDKVKSAMQLQRLLRDVVVNYLDEERRQRANNELSEFLSTVETKLPEGLVCLQQAGAKTAPAPKEEFSVSFLEAVRWGYTYAKKELPRLMAVADEDLSMKQKIDLIMQAETKTGPNEVKKIHTLKIFHALRVSDIVKLIAAIFQLDRAREAEEDKERLRKRQVFVDNLLIGLERRSELNLDVCCEHIRSIARWANALYKLPVGCLEAVYSGDEIAWIKQYSLQLLRESVFGRKYHQRHQLRQFLNYHLACVGAKNVRLHDMLAKYVDRMPKSVGAKKTKDSCSSEADHMYQKMVLKYMQKAFKAGYNQEIMRVKALVPSDPYLKTIFLIYNQARQIDSLLTDYAEHEDDEVKYIKSVVLQMFKRLLDDCLSCKDRGNGKVEIDRFWQENILTFLTIINRQTAIRKVAEGGIISRLRNILRPIEQSLRELMGFAEGDQVKPRKKFVESELAKMSEGNELYDIYVVNLAIDYFPDLVEPYVLAEDGSDRAKAWQRVMNTAAKVDSTVYTLLLEYFVSKRALSDDLVNSIVAKSLFHCKNYEAASLFLSSLTERQRGRLLLEDVDGHSIIGLSNVYIGAPFSDFMDCLSYVASEYTTDQDGRAKIEKVKQAWTNKYSFYHEAYRRAVEAAAEVEGGYEVMDDRPKETIDEPAMWANLIIKLNSVLAEEKSYEAAVDELAIEQAERLNGLFLKLLSLEKLQMHLPDILFSDKICEGDRGNKQRDYHATIVELLLYTQTVELHADLDKYGEVRNTFPKILAIKKISNWGQGLKRAYFERIIKLDDAGQRYALSRQALSFAMIEEGASPTIECLAGMGKTRPKVRDLITGFMLRLSYKSLMQLRIKYNQNKSQGRGNNLQIEKWRVVLTLLSRMDSLNPACAEPMTAEKENEMVKSLALYLPMMQSCQIGVDASKGHFSDLRSTVQLLEGIVKLQGKDLFAEGEKEDRLVGMIAGMKSSGSAELQLGLLNYLIDHHQDLVPCFMENKVGRAMVGNLPRRNGKAYQEIYQIFRDNGDWKDLLKGLPVPVKKKLNISGSVLNLHPRSAAHARAHEQVLPSWT